MLLMHLDINLQNYYCCQTAWQQKKPIASPLKIINKSPKTHTSNAPDMYNIQIRPQRNENLKIEHNGDTSWGHSCSFHLLFCVTLKPSSQVARILGKGRSTATSHIISDTSKNAIFSSLFQSPNINIAPSSILLNSGKMFC